MSQDLPTLEDLVHAICEGTPIDWDALEQLGDDTFRSQVAALRVVAGIAEVHRPKAAAPVPPPDAPQRWGHLDVLEHIASGAFGDVYRAWDPQLDREVALKLLRRAPDADAHADEVVDEGRMLARLRHPHIVSVYGAARIDGQVGLWMEFLRGRTLAQSVTADGALPIPKIAEIGAALCDALGAVHKAGLVHRDVKAQNVMLAEDGRVVLMDFGAGGDLRHAGLDIAGTPLYLAPEVARGAPASPQSDIYSLGVLLCYAATGAYSREVASPTTDKALKRLIAVAATASAHEPRDRFASADACGRQLRDLLVPSRVSRTPVVVGMGLVVGLGVLLLWLMRVGSAQDNEDRALELAWRTASPTRAPLSAEQMQSLEFDVLGPMSQSGALSAVSREERPNLLTVHMGRDDLRVWTSFDPRTGHAATAVASEDGKQLAYIWIDATCRCASLKVVDQDNRVRAVSLGREIRGAWLGGWRSHLLPVLMAPEHGPHRLAIVDVRQGVIRVVREINRDPRGFSLSPDRRFLAFDTPQHNGLGAARQVVVSSLDTGREHVVATPGSEWAQPEWSPDGTHLYFLERAARRTSILAVRMKDGHAAGPPVRLREDLGLVNTYGFVDRETLGYWSGVPHYFFTVHAQPDGVFRAHTATRFGVDGTTPAWSPDGRSLAWSSLGTWPESIQIRSSDGLSDRRLAGFLDSPAFPSWSPDGTRIAFWSTDKLTRSIQVVDLTSHKVVEAFRSGFPLFGGQFALGWTSDGAELLISPDSSQILALNPESKAVRPLYRPPDSSIELYLHQSPDRHSLAFVEAREDRRQLRIMPLDSKGLLSLMEMPPLDLIGWHADGRSVLATGHVSAGPSLFGENELWRVPIDGGPPQSLGLKAPGLIYAAMSPDGKQLAYASGIGLNELWLLRPAGVSPD